jgi:hypothetical protein
VRYADSVIPEPDPNLAKHYCGMSWYGPWHMKNNMLLSKQVVFVGDNRYRAAITEWNLAYLSGTHSLGTSLKYIHVTRCPHARHRKGTRIPGMSYSNAIILVSAMDCSTFDMVMTFI